MKKEGIIDPTLACKEALRNAVSVSKTILRTGLSNRRSMKEIEPKNGHVFVRPIAETKEVGGIELITKLR